MKKKSIIILGDSTSMSVGVDGVSYPYLLSKSSIWDCNTQIINCSIPGFTSSDLCAFFFKNIQHFNKVEAVILYTGNCDTMSSELDRPKFSLFYQYKYKIKQIFKKRSLLKLNNKLLHFKWHNTFDQDIEKATPIKKFSFNLERIIQYCQKKSILVILINPIAHQHFPSGIGSGNFSFYHYYDIEDNLSNLIDIEDKRFIKAYKNFENKEFDKSSQIYREILINHGPLADNLEYQTMVVNNYAICKAKLFNFAEAEYLLNTITSERNVRKEIILYNLSLIAKAQGDKTNYKKLIKDSYESDTLMYRIRDPYRIAIQNLADQYFTPLLDIKNIATDNSFIDHCHLLPELHQEIADFIIKQLNSSGSHKSSIDNRLYNPEYALGDDRKFEDYFGVFSELSDQDIKDQINSIDNNLIADIQNNNKLHINIKNALQYIKKHPCFNDLNSILLAPPQCPSDVGRFSELFTIRFLIPYLSYLESTPSLMNKFQNIDDLLRSSNDFRNILPKKSHRYISKDILQLSEQQSITWIDSILNVCSNQLTLHLSKGSQIDNRLKTTIFWYFREVLRFGSHSRISMRYERIILENIAEALAFSSIIDEKYLNGQYDSRITQLLNFLRQTVYTHNEHVGLFIPGDDNAQLILAYNNALNKIHQELQSNKIC